MIYFDYNATTPVLPEVLVANAELKDTEDKNTFSQVPDFFCLTKNEYLLNFSRLKNQKGDH